MKHLTIILLLLSTQLHAQYEWIEKKDYTNLPSLTLTPKEVVYHYIIIEEWKQGKKDIDSLSGKCKVMSARITQMGAENNDAFKRLQIVTSERDALAEDKEKYSVRQTTLEQAAKYDKPFGISPAVIYDANGKVRFGIGLTWTPIFLRFRL